MNSTSWKASGKEGVEMLYQPEMVVYLMLLPVLCLIVIPAAISLARFIIGTAVAAGEAEHSEAYEQEALA